MAKNPLSLIVGEHFCGEMSPPLVTKMIDRLQGPYETVVVELEVVLSRSGRAARYVCKIFRYCDRSIPEEPVLPSAAPASGWLGHSAQRIKHIQGCSMELHINGNIRVTRAA